MDINTISAIIFLASLAVILFIERKKVSVQKILFPVLYFVMYKTSLGLKAMDKYAKNWKKTIKALSYTGIFVGFLGMIAISIELIKNVIEIFLTKAPVPGVGVVLPIEAKGVFFVPFIYWIISIFLVAGVHEFSHGVVARRFGMKIKSSGIAFFSIIIPIIPAAFVEPDEHQVKKKPFMHQQAMFAAGPFSNILFGLICLLLLMFVFTPVSESISYTNGLSVISVREGYPAAYSGIEQGDIITRIDDTDISDIGDFTDLLKNKEPKDKVTFTVKDRGDFIIELTDHPDNKTTEEGRPKGYLGISVGQNMMIKEDVNKRYGFIIDAYSWLQGLVFWLFLLNIGIGLFNLVPLGPVDGGRMLHLLSVRYLGKKKGEKAWKIISTAFLIILAVIIGMSFFG